MFEEIAQSLEVAGEQGHRQRAYRRAARGVAATRVPLEQMAAEGRLRDIPGVGAALAALIAEFLETGQIRTHARLVDEHPPGLAPLLNARGFGPAGVQALHAAIGAADLDDVERAGQEGRLAQALGQRRADDLLAQLPTLRNPSRALRLKPAWESATLLVDLLCTEAARIEVAGAARRMCEMVIGGLDLVAIPSSGDGRLLDLLERLPSVVKVLHRDADGASVRLADGIELRVHLAADATFGSALARHTATTAHLTHLESLGALPTAAATEEQFYAALDLPCIAPELREDQGEIEAAQAGALPRLIEVADLKGDMHCHTNETDGTATLEEMASAARDRGYQYMALTDHSRSLAITNGLSLERLEQARELVRQLNERLAPFVILLGTEMDILVDGTLDYPDETLASLDYVSASVHSRFKQAGPEMTARILRAVSHPLVNTLNHPHGRLLGMRASYAVDMGHVIQTAAAAGCAMEVSADPARMDLDGGWARRVRAAGGRCTVSSDAHSTLDFDNIWLGIGSARRGWLEAKDVLNTLPLAELRSALKRSRRTD